MNNEPTQQWWQREIPLADSIFWMLIALAGGSIFGCFLPH